MAGGWETYLRDRCPLAFELGGSTWWDEAGVVRSQTVQVACTGCGTMHRVTEEGGGCRASALPGPVRTARTGSVRDVSGEEHPTTYWFTESEWVPVGPFAGGCRAVDQLPCGHCGRVGMITLAKFKLPFHVAVAGGRGGVPGVPQPDGVRCRHRRDLRSGGRNGTGWQIGCTGRRLLPSPFVGEGKTSVLRMR